MVVTELVHDVEILVTYITSKEYYYLALKNVAIKKKNTLKYTTYLFLVSVIFFLITCLN